MLSWQPLLLPLLVVFFSVQHPKIIQYLYTSLYKIIVGNCQLVPVTFIFKSSAISGNLARSNLPKWNLLFEYLDEISEKVGIKKWTLGFQLQSNNISQYSSLFFKSCLYDSNVKIFISDGPVYEGTVKLK